MGRAAAQQLSKRRLSGATSAGARENSFLWRDRDGVGGGSYFAQELCEGLRSREFDYNADGQVTLAEAYQGLLESHGASTAQSYPQQSDFALYAYDPDLADTAERPIGAITLDSAVLSEKEDTLYFSFTVRRAVRVQYQLIYYKNGLWRFDTPQTIEDPENETGALTPGRKERSVSLLAEEDEPYGYVLLQLVAQEGRRAMLAGSRLIAVQRDTGNPVLRIRCGESFDPAHGEELAVYVGHRFPCSLTVTVRDAQGQTVRRLAYKTPSRPLGLGSEASLFYWDGRNAAGELAAAGEYVIEASCTVDGQKYLVTSGTVRIGK